MSDPEPSDSQEAPKKRNLILPILILVIAAIIIYVVLGAPGLGVPITGRSGDPTCIADQRQRTADEPSITVTHSENVDLRLVLVGAGSITAASDEYVEADFGPARLETFTDTVPGSYSAQIIDPDTRVVIRTITVLVNQGYQTQVRVACD